MPTPTLGSVLLASANVNRLREWYERAFGVVPNPDGFLEFGGVSVLIDPYATTSAARPPSLHG